MTVLLKYFYFIVLSLLTLPMMKVFARQRQETVSKIMSWWLLIQKLAQTQMPYVS